MSKLHPNNRRMPKYESESWRRMVMASEGEGYLGSYAIPVTGSGEIPEILNFVSGEITEIVANAADGTMQQADITEQGFAVGHIHVLVAKVRPDFSESL